MNRNNEAHFNQVPKMHASRATFKRDQKILTTFNAGELIPFYVDEVLPGDTFRVSTSAIIRQQTPKYPVMDDAYIDIYYFSAPNRILWKSWKEFMGEASLEPWMPASNLSVPQIKIRKDATSEAFSGPKKDSILDYMGVPNRVITKNGSEVEDEISINALPIRAYVMIWNEFFRDQNVDNPATLLLDDSDTRYEDYTGDTESTIEQTLNLARTGGRCLPVNKFHDYFTSCLPYPQRGPEVNLPMTGNASITLYSDKEMTNALKNTNVHLDGRSPANPVFVSKPGNSTSTLLGATTSGGTSAIRGFLGADLSSVNATTINDLREAIAVQHYYEAMARGGSRYREQLQAIWGVTTSDKTMQIPEYLGGGRYKVNVNQVVQSSAQAQTNGTDLGSTGAISVTPINESSFTKSFEEHGFIIGVMCIRHDRTYQQGLERFWSRTDRLDYYVPQFANLGEQPVKKKEIMLTGKKASDDATFGYQEAWADYRMKPNRVSGEMRSNYEQSLDAWHYADEYDTVPTLSSSWMKEGRAEIDRTLIVQNHDQFFGGLYIQNRTTREMPLYSVPGLERI